jgi:hypothetical protein
MTWLPILVTVAAAHAAAAGATYKAPRTEYEGAKPRP